MKNFLQLILIVVLFCGLQTLSLYLFSPQLITSIEELLYALYFHLIFDVAVCFLIIVFGAIYLYGKHK